MNGVTDQDKTTEQVQVREDYYAIALTLSRGWSRRENESPTIDVYFKADRYSCYGGRLQTEWHVESAMHFKTARGAAKAIDRLVAKGTIKPEHNPRVVRYTETITRRWEILEAQTAHP